MEVLLTVKEQDRENALFSPREAKYLLPVDKIDLWTYIVQVSEDEFVVQAPLSC